MLARSASYPLPSQAVLCRSSYLSYQFATTVVSRLITMFGSKILSTVLLAALSVASVSAVTVEKVRARQDQTCVATCGSVCYYQEDLDEAVKTGYGLHQQGKTVGSNDYPHEYEDREGFDFPGPSPYYEFPILSSFEPYDGGSPGADRVVFNDDGDFQGAITHTGASGNNFVECT
ncbi:ribonuclease-domain-containing protein [Hypoxylon trugodes]|uniref:ribonuclease-domain-containing protein n=1 Tax=Hypoxylon trugodes TaxID=326681 RepID=UPI002194C85A|nr:ribonuclease-domain-containing protein [Hypoxylon trugodes]KAI1384854.1 ribonuclease-domain-containing protein [Hypoxylon trugodes]